MVGKHISLMGSTDPYSDMCVGKHASLVICVRETRIPGKHISLWHRDVLPYGKKFSRIKSFVVFGDSLYDHKSLFPEIYLF